MTPCTLSLITGAQSRLVSRLAKRRAEQALLQYIGRSTGGPPQQNFKDKVAGLIVPLIMCDGAGTHLWPASRENRPKQFLPLFGRFSTFQESLRRVSDPSLFGRPIIVTNAQFRFLVAE